MGTPSLPALFIEPLESRRLCATFTMISGSITISGSTTINYGSGSFVIGGGGGTEQSDPVATQPLSNLKIINDIAEDPRGLTVVGNQAFFFARKLIVPTSVHGEMVLVTQSAPQLWKTDGTTAGTVQITKDLGESSDYQTVALGKYLYFFNDHYLYRSDGTGAHTQRISPRFGGPTRDLATNGSSVFFSESDVKTGENRELWAYDSAAGLRKFEINPGGASSSPQQFASFGGRMFFSALSADRGYEIFESDGTASGTHVAIDLAPGTKTSDPSDLTVAGGTLFFTAIDPLDSRYRVLFASDGTIAGTHMVQDALGRVPRAPTLVTTFHNTLVFSSPSGTWRTDGSSGGTTQLSPMVATEIVASDNVLYFTAVDDAKNVIVKSDGTPAGTTVARRFFGVPNLRGAIKDLLYFNLHHANDALWQSDGTHAGTFALTGTEIADDQNFDSEPVVAVRNTLLVASDAYYSGRLRALDLRRGSIAGTCFRDANRDGVFDPETESTYAGYTIFLDLNHNHVLDANEPKCFSDHYGDYHFDRLKPGTYDVRIVTTDRKAETDAFTVGVVAGRSRSRDFSLVGGTISGFVFDDANSNGVFDAGEDPLSGFRIYLDLNGDGHFQSTEPWIRTNSAGKYRFDDLLPKAYRVSITPISTRLLTTAQAFHLNLARGASATRNFGTTLIV
jgi:ELWxxDGT repeat protein